MNTEAIEDNVNKTQCHFTSKESNTDNVFKTDILLKIDVVCYKMIYVTICTKVRNFEWQVNFLQFYRYKESCQKPISGDNSSHVNSHFF